MERGWVDMGHPRKKPRWQSPEYLQVGLSSRLAA
jgi:hypothetical protein